LNGPVFGPIIGGFVTENLGWRWTHWIVLILAGFSWVFVCTLKETYAPALLQKKAAKIRDETGDPRYWSRYDERMSLKERLKINLSRPFKMTIFEPIVIFFNVFIALIYGILYLCFVAYPIVFTELRGWGPGIGGLAFVGIGVGSLIIIVLEPLIRRMINSHKPDPETGKPPPESMMSIICIAACLTPIGELWFAWTCYPARIHWVWPILAGIPFGAGNTAIFIYASNYLAHSYGIYSASAMASNAIVRSLLGGTLPLAGPSLYRALGPNWAATLLGLLEVLIIPIPVVFYKYGYRIRMKSALISSMQEDKRRLDGKRAKGERNTAAAAAIGGLKANAVDVELTEKEKEEV
jgi:MFS family permease